MRIYINLFQQNNERARQVRKMRFGSCFRVTLRERTPRSSRPEVFCKKGILRNFAKIHRKAPAPEPLLIKLRFQSYYFQVKSDALVFEEKCLVFQKSCFKVKVMKNLQGLSYKNVTKIF